MSKAALKSAKAEVYRVFDNLGPLKSTNDSHLVAAADAYAELEHANLLKKARKGETVKTPHQISLAIRKDLSDTHHRVPKRMRGGRRTARRSARLSARKTARRGY